ncbi:MAG TPA: DegT/DnrJ/EryC1/StrS aminotransferase family protein [Nocardioidaceae bacterium]|nr:DegT/DnrJ/EryC1/StrS aminotransferase family protein [Nocardioidaceae bacterium]
MNQKLSVTEPQIGPDERHAVDRVLRGTAGAPGHEVAAFESEFATYLGASTCVAVNSGSSALHLGLMAAGVGPGDEVIVPSFTSVATVNSVAASGATPVFADIDPDSFCLDPRAVEAAVGPRTAAVLPVHLFGQPADMTAFTRIAERHGLALVEDACQAHGAAWEKRKVGTFGAVAAFSFSRTKNMTTTDGGMVVCADDAIADKVRALRDQGMAKCHDGEVVGLNARMTDVSAAMGRVQLHRLAGFNRVRRMNAALLTMGLRRVETPPQPDEAWHVFQQYVVRSAAPAQLADHLAQAGIATATPYAVPVHRLPAYAQQLDLPETERAAAESLSLPVHPGIAGVDVRTIVRAVNEATATRAA